MLFLVIGLVLVKNQFASFSFSYKINLLLVIVLVTLFLVIALRKNIGLTKIIFSLVMIRVRNLRAT